jgi:branched-chain amino acid transport system permease protein
LGLPPPNTAKRLGGVDLALRYNSFVRARTLRWIQAFQKVPGPEMPAPFNPGNASSFYASGFAAFSTWMTANIAHSRFGRSLIAIRDAEVAAKACGISKPALLMTVFLFSVAVAGVAGGLFASLQSYITPDAFTFDLSVLFFIAILIGGRDSISALYSGP